MSPHFAEGILANQRNQQPQSAIVRSITTVHNSCKIIELITIFAILIFLDEQFAAVAIWKFEEKKNEKICSKYQKLNRGCGI